MAKAWMPFYIADYLADTGHLDHEEHGVYVLAIMHYWQSEQPLPANVKQMQSICRCFACDKFEQIWNVVSKFFRLTEDGWVHDRIESELERSRKISKTRKISGSAGGKTTQANAKANAQANAQAKIKQLPTQSQSHKESNKKKNTLCVLKDPFPFKEMFSEPFLTSDQFQFVWHSWVEERSASRKKLTERSAGMQAKFLSQYQISTAISIIETSIANGWTGLFPPKEAGMQKPVRDEYDKPIYRRQ